jgi:spermidine/putrescine transport system permease protein
VSWLRRNAVMIVGGIVVAYMLIPIAVVIAFSFNDPAGKFNFTWSGFTIEYWTHAFSLPDLNEALVTSLQLGIISTLIATILGTLIALALVRYEFFGRRTANLLIVIPMATPEVVIGAALLSLFVYFATATGFTTLLIAHVMFTISFVVIVVRSRLIGFDRSLEEAARDLGAPPLTTFSTVTLPLLIPGLASAALLSFALSLDDFVISNFNSGSTVTFPLFIYGATQRGVPVQVNVLATMLFLLTVVAMVVTIVQQRRAEKLAAVRPDDDDPVGLLALGPAIESLPTHKDA